jgi:hypothetical protein
MSRATSIDDFKLRGTFEAVRKTLLEPPLEDRLDKPLAYWALPKDRRLPLAFLGRSVRDLLDTPFDALCATPGVGQKKIQSLIKLLNRAIKEVPVAAPFLALDEGPAKDTSGNGRGQPATEVADDFDPDFVSEALWSTWRATVLARRLEHETLGRLAPSLQNLPTVIWRTPLKFYAEHSLAEIRALRTHGEKRVRVVLEVFYVVNRLLAKAETHPHLSIRLMPSFAAELDFWLDETMYEGRIPLPDEVRDCVARRFLDQIRADAGESVYELAAGRLGLDEEPQSVRLQSRRLGVTRARVYQLLEECTTIMAVRWPEGRRKLRLFERTLESAGATDSAHCCRMVRELFYADKGELADAAK